VETAVFHFDDKWRRRCAALQAHSAAAVTAIS
jgi:hypothetical protein